MKKTEKQDIIDGLVKNIEKYNHFYITDTFGLDALATSELRRACHEKEIKLFVVKNTLLKKALEKVEENDVELFNTLKGPSSIMFSNTGNIPAKLIKQFRKKYDKPLLKAAFVEESIYLGEEQLGVLYNIKSKEEIIGDILTLLQTPMTNVISSLNSGKNTLANIVKTLAKKK